MSQAGLLGQICIAAILLGPFLSGCRSQELPKAKAESPTVEAAIAPSAVPIRIRIQDLPKPFETASASKPPQVLPRPADATFQVPPGFTVNAFAQGLSRPRWLTVGPNGDVFLAESYDNRIRLLRDANGDGVAEANTIFAEGLNQPFGMAIAPDRRSFYVANTNAVVRFPYQVGQARLQGQPVTITSLTEGGYNQHWTRNLIFSPDGKKLFVSIGSQSNADMDPPPRATIQIMNPDGSDRQTYASGLRNPVGLAFHPTTAKLYTTVNERDGLGDDLVPDYLTSVQQGGFYGWPYAYLGANHDPRLPSRPDLEQRTIVPEVLFQAHSAALGLAFYTASMFPPAYRQDAFVAFRGSWNRDQGTGYKVVRVPFDAKGQPKGYYEDFVTGWTIDPKIPSVWGRPVGLAIAQDGSLLIADESGGVIWRVAYRQPAPSARS